MKNIAYRLILTTGLVFGLVSFNANAGLITNGWWSGIVSDAVVEHSSTPGSSTENKIYWGSNNGSGNGYNSSWLFKGVSNSDPWSGDDYLHIGTFKHKNKPIYDYEFWGATLNIGLDYGGEMSMASLELGHYETLNWGEPCLYGENPCSDIVTLLGATDTINIGGMSYELMIKGFNEKGELDTPEKGWSKAHLYIAKVPEPSIIALFGIGLLGLGFASRRKSS